MIVSNYWDFRAVFAPGSPLGIDGYPVWPVAQTVGAPSIITTWQNPFPMTMTFATSNFADAVAGVDEWDWYLQQPCELVDASAARLQLLPWTADLPATWSGKTRLALTAAGSAFLTSQSPELMSQLFRNCFVFIRQISNSNITVWDLHRSAFAPGTY